MSDYISLTGEVVFNKLTTPDLYMGNSKYTLTIALDKAGKKVAEKNGLTTMKVRHRLLLSVSLILVSLKFMMQTRMK